jgi:hypothetical protein
VNGSDNGQLRRVHSSSQLKNTGLCCTTSTTKTSTQARSASMNEQHLQLLLLLLGCAVLLAQRPA